jgi:hypothetical protein
MSACKVIAFGENTRTATYADGLAFIERTRRQLDRFDDAMPQAGMKTISPEDRDGIRRQLDKLESSIRKDIGAI